MHADRPNLNGFGVAHARCQHLQSEDRGTPNPRSLQHCLGQGWRVEEQEVGLGPALQAARESGRVPWACW